MWSILVHHYGYHFPATWIFNLILGLWSRKVLEHPAICTRLPLAKSHKMQRRIHTSRYFAILQGILVHHNRYYFPATWIFNLIPGLRGERVVEHPCIYTKSLSVKSRKMCRRIHPSREVAILQNILIHCSINHYSTTWLLDLIPSLHSKRVVNCLAIYISFLLLKSHKDWKRIHTSRWIVIL